MLRISRSRVGDVDQMQDVAGISPPCGLRSCLRVKTMEESLSLETLASSWRDDTVTSTLDTAATSRSCSSLDECSSRSIRFEKLEVRDYPLALGDNPSVTNGPPLTIEWEHAGEYVISVEDYENNRPPRRHKRNMVVPKRVRQDWLRDEGYSRGEMNEAEKQALKAKKDRMATAKKRIVLVRLEEVSEMVRRKLMRVVLRKPKQAILYDTWKLKNDAQRHELLWKEL